MGKIQDICVGIQTPLLQKVRSPKLREDSVFSIVCDDRTFDLQAESAEQQQLWVSCLKAQYKLHMQDHGVDREDTLHLPKALGKRMKAYEKKWWCDKCAMKVTYRKLLAV